MDMSDIDNLVADLPEQEVCVYALKEKHTIEGETSKDQVQERVAKALANNTQEEGNFLATLRQGFVPGGRINAAAGSGLVATMMNCFVQPIADTMSGSINGRPGIMTAFAHAMETMRRGGGEGYNFSHLRPKGARVKGTNSQSSGPVSYMRMFDAGCDTVESAGARRGAQMGVLRIDHPDVMEFITCKATPDFNKFGLTNEEVDGFMGLMRRRSGFAWEVRKKFAGFSNFNISVGVTNAFMQALFAGEKFPLVHVAEPSFAAERMVCADGVERFIYEWVDARELWKNLLWQAYTTGDPGIIFIDKVNEVNNLWYCEVLEASNPCGEQFLPDYGCCDLGSPNLCRFVRNPFTEQAYFDYDAFKRTVAGGVRLLDRVLDKTNWPLPEQHQEAMNKRRIGEGYMGLGSALAMLNVTYGSPESLTYVEKIGVAMRDAAYLESIELAKENGPFPLFDADSYLKPGTFASTLPQEIQDAIRVHGIRNSHLLSIAPTGTIALSFGDNVSNGIEPIFAHRTLRSVRTGNGEERRTFEVDDHAVRVYKAIYGNDADLSHIKTALELTPEEHMAVVEVAAKYIDSSISKTINVPYEYSFEDFKGIYESAFRKNLKGITCYRPNEMVGSVLEDISKGKKEESQQDLRVDDPDRRVEIKDVPNMVEQLRWPSRPDIDTHGVTYQVRHPQGDFAVVVNHWENGRQHPMDVYVAGNEQPRGLAAIAKSLSVDMRTDDGAFLAMKLDSLLNVVDEDGFQMRDPATGNVIQMPSLTAGFAHLVKHRLNEIGAFQEQGESKMLNALFSRREPKTGPQGSIGWHVDVNNPATGDDFLLHTKELRLPNGQVRPYSVWVSGKYPKVLDGLMKVLSIDMRVSDPKWVAMKLKKLTNFGELRGDFLAQVPGDVKQINYPSTVAYVATLLLARMKVLGLLDGADLQKQENGETATASKPDEKSLGKAGGGKFCPECKTMSLRKVDGCEICSHCGHTGSCG